MIDWVAAADTNIQGIWTNWNFMLEIDWYTDLVIGTPTIAAPADLGQWDKTSFVLDYSTNKFTPLACYDYKTWRDNFRNGLKSNSTPGMIIVMPDKSLRIDPPPSSVRRVSGEYWRLPAKMSADADTSPVPEEFERIIIARAKMHYAEYESASEVMVGAGAEYAELLDKLEANYLPLQEPRRNSDSNEIIIVRPM